MKSVISSTYDDKYFWFLPLVSWAWNKIGVDVICFLPHQTEIESQKKLLVSITMKQLGIKGTWHHFETTPNKEATYAQCARLYAGCLDLPEDEIIITGDIDMLVFGDFLKQKVADFDIFGFDLCPPNQYPICYISATVKNWRGAMGINGRSYQEYLDDLLGSIEGEHIRGNYWAKDQETAYQLISKHNNIYLHARAKPGTQFSTNRIDRDDAYWEERLHPGIVDAHLWRPGFSEENFPKILKLLKTMYPNDGFDWLVDYNEKYKALCV